MASPIRHHWPKIIGALSIALAAISRAGDIDFVVSRLRDSDWIGTVMAQFVAMPDWLVASLAIFGTALIVWDVCLRGRLFGDVDRIKIVTQEEYDAIPAPAKRTMYCIVDEKPQDLEKKSKVFEAIKRSVLETKLILSSFATGSAIIILMSVAAGAAVTYFMAGG